MSTTIPAVLARAVAEFPGREAIVDGPLRWTFAELAEQTYRCAAAMIASGVERGDRVAVWAPNGHRFAVAALGAVTAGATLVPVNTRYKGEEAAWILGQSGARLLAVDNGFLGHDYLAMLRTAAPDLASVTEIITLNGAGGVPWPEFLGRGLVVPRADVTKRAAEVTERDI
jgi:HIP---CoA ligase